MLSFGALRYADHRSHPVGLDTDAIPSNAVVELLRRHHLGAFQASSVSERPAPANVVGNGEWDLDDERYQTEKQREPVKVEKAVTGENLALEIGTQRAVDIGLLWSQIEEHVATLQRELRKGKRDGLAARLRRRAVRHVSVRRQTRWNSAGAHHKHPVVVSAGRSDRARNGRPDVERR